MATTARASDASPANVTKTLKGIDFPANKQDLLKHAKQMKAEQVVVDEIQNMEDREYGSMADVMKAFEPQQFKQWGQQAQQGQQTQQKQVKSHGKQQQPHHR